MSKSKYQHKILGSSKLHSKHIARIIAYSSIGLLGILGVVILYPPRPSVADAIDLTEGQSQATREAEVSVFVQSAISLAMSSRVDIDVIPKSNGSFSSSSATLAVATNNSTGYGIYLGTKDQSQELKLMGSSNDNAMIAPITGTLAADSFTANTWGYSLVDQGTSITSYQAVPGNTTQIEHVAEADTGLGVKHQYDLSFGTMVDTTLPAGVYSNSVVVSVVANPREIQNLTEAIYLQDFDGTRNANGTTNTTSKICEQSTVGMTKQLIDTRDGKKYWVAKLADNNCWMTQNLALDLTQGTVYTSADTDLAGNWTVPTSMETKVPTDGSNVTTSTRSWNMGEYVLVTPVNVAECTIASGQTFEKCPNFMEVSDLLPTMNEIVEGEWNGYSGPLSVNVTNNTYNSHYLIGRYYQWNTATAGSGGSMTSGNATNSICPGGWKLPTSQQIATQLSAYGITNNQVGTKKDENGIFYNIALAPLFYTRTGVVSTVNRNGAYMTLRGYSWSSTASAADSSYALLFDGATSVTSADKNYRYNGTTVRCVAR